MSINRNETVVGPARGLTRALAVTTSQASFDLSDVFGDAHADGNYITLSCNQVFYIQFSNSMSDDINITDSLVEDSTPVAGDNQQAAGPYAANTPYRMLVPGSRAELYKYLHVIAANTGILRIWKSSSNLV